MEATLWLLGKDCIGTINGCPWKIDLWQYLDFTGPLVLAFHVLEHWCSSLTNSSSSLHSKVSLSPGSDTAYTCKSIPWQTRTSWSPWEGRTPRKNWTSWRAWTAWTDWVWRAIWTSWSQRWVKLCVFGKSCKRTCLPSFGVHSSC